MTQLLGNLFSRGFRPLFLLVGLYAIGGMLAWIGLWTGWWSFPLNRMAVYWHGHEMIMGLAAAAIGGFLLTAVANWTGRAPVAGWPLAALCLLWLAGRLSVGAPAVTAVSDFAYWLMLWVLVARDILGAGNRRNYKVLFVLAALAIADALFHWAELYRPEYLQRAFWLQLWLVLLLINLIGGRIIPAFTGNWLRRRDAPAPMPPAFGRLDLAGSIAMGLFALALIVPVPTAAIVALGLVAAILQGGRLMRWQGLRTLSEPLVWMLHLSWAWIPLGILLWTLAAAQLLPVAAAVHALAIGAMAGMIVSVAARASLGHSGQPLQSSPLLTAAILLLNGAAVSRIMAVASDSEPWMLVGALLWLLAFLAFLWRLLPAWLAQP